MRREQVFFSTPSGVIVLNTPALQRIHDFCGCFFPQCDFYCAWTSQGRLLCCQLLSMSDSRNKFFFFFSLSVFVVFTWLYGCNKSLGRETPAVFSLQKDREFQLHMKKSFIFYWNQLHWTFYQVLSRFSFHTRNALFCLHFEMFGCCFNPLIYLPFSTLWSRHLLPRKANKNRDLPGQIAVIVHTVNTSLYLYLYPASWVMSVRRGKTGSQRRMKYVIPPSGVSCNFPGLLLLSKPCACF